MVRARSHRRRRDCHNEPRAVRAGAAPPGNRFNSLVLPRGDGRLACRGFGDGQVARRQRRGIGLGREERVHRQGFIFAVGGHRLDSREEEGINLERYEASAK